MKTAPYKKTLLTPAGRKVYDVAIVGGGLAGLSLSIQLAKAGYRVAVFEKELYPFHKVCGEYISFESWNFLEEAGIPLSDWNLPIIRRLQVSAPNGRALLQELPLGGFGISRYKLDAALAEVARSQGVDLFEQSKVSDVIFGRQQFTVIGPDFSCQAKLVCGTFGKRSNLDVKWKRSFTRKKSNKLNNFIAVKYHIQTDFPPDLIALHNFSQGYCGISHIEDNKCCLCYLTTAENLRISGNSIDNMEQQILQRNPHLQKIFSASLFLYDQPLTISQISFEKKTQVDNHILLIGDAAGMIAPLCGNGMSMALHGSKIAFECIQPFLDGTIARHEMEQQFTDRWNRQFSKRLQAGRLLQRFFGSEVFSNFLVRSLEPFPRVITWLIRKTHGAPF
ncbi:MAG TPA: NAD(P)/FAD-dependent oxidoreductase [Puia sp.]|nr:NAD(P)/FAD-dependent oxidoreductase [Puia sp.]